MTVSSVPAHLSRGMSDYAWSLRRAVLHQLLPHATLKAGLPLFSPPTPAPWNPASAASLSVSTVIYYTSIVMKTCLIHNVYCGRKKWLVNLKNRALLQRWQNKKKLHNEKRLIWQSIIVWGYLKVDTFSGPCMKRRRLSIPRKHIYHITPTEGKKGCPLHRAPGKVIKPQLYFRQLADAHVPGDLQRVRK